MCSLRVCRCRQFNNEACSKRVRLWRIENSSKNKETKSESELMYRPKTEALDLFTLLRIHMKKDKQLSVFALCSHYSNQKTKTVQNALCKRKLLKTQRRSENSKNAKTNTLYDSYTFNCYDMATCFKAGLTEEQIGEVIRSSGDCIRKYPCRSEFVVFDNLWMLLTNIQYWWHLLNVGVRCIC